MIHLTLNIAAFALWLLEVMFWAAVSVGGWIALALAAGSLLVLGARFGVRRLRRRRGDGE